jgi:hypothetical protein
VTYGEVLNGDVAPETVSGEHTAMLASTRPGGDKLSAGEVEEYAGDVGAWPQS